MSSVLMPVKRNQHQGSKTQYERILNDTPIPKKEFQSNGGKVHVANTKWGLWLRQNDPIRFNKMYEKWLAEQLLKPAE
jgi:hypothetical protein